MQADTQRRVTRVPLGVLVELTHEDFDEPFEADGIDVGVGGLGMRAAFLPDVGSRMKAAFADPALGRRVEAPCEVVWAKDSGPHVGQVGLRFTSLESGARRAIEGMVARAADEPSAVSPRKHVIEPEVEELAGEDHTAVRLFIDGVDAAIPARVVARYEGGVRVVQRLGLFRLGTEVDVQNGARRRSRIESVAIRTDGDVPELILDLALDASHPVPAAGPRVALPEAPLAEPPDASSLDAEADALLDADAPDTIPDTPSPRVEHAMPTPVGVVASADTAPPSPVEVPEATVQPPSLGMRARRAADGLMPLLRRLRAAMVACASVVGPWLGRTRMNARALIARVRPVTRRVWGRTAMRVSHFASALASRTGARLPWAGGRAKKRRTTAPPPTRSNVARKQGAAPRAADPRRERARTTMLAIVAFAGAAALVYALSPGSDDAVDTHRPIERTVSATSGSAADEAAGDESVEASDEATAQPAPAKPQAPGTVPPSSPYADPVEADEEAHGASEAAAPELTRAFGAPSVPDGRTFLLRMSQPVEALRGTAERNGFTVIVPDSLSLDRAGPIAAAHPAVERSLVLNRGDHAELSIRFVEGKTPTYRVRGRGRALEITFSE
jgi:hypothetical protein